MTYVLTPKLEKQDPLTGRRRNKLRPVTGRQLEVLRFVRRYIATYRCSPVVREVCDFLEMKSAQSALRHLHVLVRKGMTVPLIGRNGSSRGYELTEAGIQATEHLDLSPIPPLKEAV